VREREQEFEMEADGTKANVKAPMSNLMATFHVSDSEAGSEEEEESHEI